MTHRPSHAARSPVLLLLVVAAAVTAAIAAVSTPSHATTEAAHKCLIEPRLRAEIGSPVQGIVERVHVARGQAVVAGEPLAQLRASIERATVDHAEARAGMRSEIAAREADLELAGLELARAEDLFSQKLVPQQELDEARARRQIAAAAVVQALENHQLLHLELARAERRLEERTLRAPFDGVVTAVSTFPGEFVYDEPVVTLAEVDPLRVEVVLPAELIERIRPGDSADIVAELGNQALVATVETVDRVLDAASGTFGVQLVLPNPSRRIVAGQTCRIHFDLGEPSTLAESSSG